jgi:hypothetical protein
MSYKLIRVEYKSSVEWYDTNTELTEEDINQIEELYAGDVGAFLDNNRRIDEDKAWEGELVREKDTGTEVDWLIEEEL